MVSAWREWEVTRSERGQILREWRETGTDEDRGCDGRTASRETWKE